MDYGFQYIQDNEGIDTDDDYPYVSGGGNVPSCDTGKQARHVGTVTGYHDVPKSNAAQMEAALNKGPVSIAIEADQSGFQRYSGGIFSGTCGTNLDHGVLTVGFTENYWIVKNSWGASWGLSGYIRMGRTADSQGGQCGMLMSASYPDGGPQHSPGPSPSPAPGPGPSPSTCSNYENPIPNGCKGTEKAIRLQGLTGSFCSPQCQGFTRTCPDPDPTCYTGATPQCVIQDSADNHYCGLMCDPNDADSCDAPGMTCRPIQGQGICMWGDSEESTEGFKFVKPRRKIRKQKRKAKFLKR